MQKKGFILSCFVCTPLDLACSHLFDRYIHNAQILVQTLSMRQHSIFGQYSKKPANVHTGEKCRKQNMLIEDLFNIHVKPRFFLEQLENQSNMDISEQSQSKK